MGPVDSWPALAEIRGAGTTASEDDGAAVAAGAGALGELAEVLTGLGSDAEDAELLPVLRYSPARLPDPDPPVVASPEESVLGAACPACECPTDGEC